MGMIWGNPSRVRGRGQVQSSRGPDWIPDPSSGRPPSGPLLIDSSSGIYLLLLVGPLSFRRSFLTLSIEIVLFPYHWRLHMRWTKRISCVGIRLVQFLFEEQEMPGSSSPSSEFIVEIEHLSNIGFMSRPKHDQQLTLK